MAEGRSRRLSLVVCGAGPATDVAGFIDLAMAAGWTVDTIATMAALPFLDTSAIESLTGMPVRSQPRDPRSARRRSPGDSAAFMVAPATFNTINKLALGIADTYPLTVLAEAIGSRAPVVVVPFVNSALASRRPYQEALARLRSEGVRILEGEEDGWLPHPPGTGGQQQQSFPWRRALKAIAMP